MTSHRHVPTVVRGGPAVRVTTRLAVRNGDLHAVGGGAYWGGRAWWYDAELGRAERDMAAGRFGVGAGATRPDSRRRWPGRDEVEYPLGVCESELGHIGPALDAWARVPDDSVFAPRAALERARLALEHGRFAAAEESLRRIEDARGEIGDAAMRLAQQLDLFSGRGYRINRRIERHWRSSRDQVMQLRTHWLYDTQPYPIDAVREALERLGREAPDDDRVWLGKADIATRTGQFDEADAWLTRCEARRPEDPDVWRARLAWALDAGRPDAASIALTHLPADGFSPAEVAGFAARLAALRGDAAAEHAALERRVALEPGDAAAWARLADLASRDRVGGADLQARARRRKAELDRANDEYRMLMGAVATGDLTRKAELARAAEALNRRFEARSWWTLRVRENLDDREAREALDRLVHSEPDAKAAGAPPRSDARPARRRPCPRRHSRREGMGTVPTSRPRIEPTPTVPAFRDDAACAGLRFVYDNDQSSLRRLPETMGGGLGLIDFDGDGWLDIYAVQGGKFPPAPGEDIPNGDRLFRNTGRRHLRGRHRPRRDRRVPPRLRPRGRRGRYRQRRPPRPVRHPLAVVRPLPQQGGRHLRGRHRPRRARRRPRLADLIGLRRSRRRRRPRPVCLPLPRTGTRTSRPPARTPTTRGDTCIAALARSNRSRTMSTGTTRGASST